MKGSGTYALLIHLPAPQSIRVGRLGVHPFPAGYYLYLGSGRGPGGLIARLSRHLRKEKQLHWHIDYFVSSGTIRGAWVRWGTEHLECEWAEALRKAGGQIICSGFGSSDCRCQSHLLYWELAPAWEALFAGLGATPIAAVKSGNAGLPEHPTPE